MDANLVGNCSWRVPAVLGELGPQVPCGKVAPSGSCPGWGPVSI